MTDVTVLSRTQIVRVNPTSGKVAVINAGPAGPGGSGLTGGAQTIAGEKTFSSDMFLPGVYDGIGGVDGGVVREAVSINIPWAYSLDTAPADVAVGTAFHVDAQVTVQNGGAGQPVGPEFATSHFGPRGVYNLEGLVRYERDQTVFAFAPVGYADTLAIANNSGVARILRPSWTFMSARGVVADGVSTVTLDGNDYNEGGAAFVDTPTFATTDGGTLDGLTNNHEVTSFLSGFALWGNSDMFRRIGLRIKAGAAEGAWSGQPHFSGAGTIDTLSATLSEEIGVFVDAFTLGTTKIGVYSSPPIVADDGFYGGRDASDNLLLASTMHATHGRIRLRDYVDLISEDKTNTTNVGINLIDVPTGRTFTLNDTSGGFNSGNALTALNFQATILYDENSSVFLSGSLFNASPILKNRNGEARTIAEFFPLNAQPTLQADGATLTAGGSSGLRFNPIMSTIGGGTLNVTDLTAVRVVGDLSHTAGTVALLRGLHMQDPQNSGALTTLVGVDIAALTKGSTNIGIRNASTEVATPSVATLSAAGNTITANAKVKRLNNTSGGALTLTSTPTIADGQDGQMLMLINGSANPVTLQHGTTFNLRLDGGTDKTLAQRSSICLMYSTTIGDWVQIGSVVTPT